MSTNSEEVTDEEIIDEEELNWDLTNNARVEITLNTTFLHRSLSQWTKVRIEDGPGLLGEDKEGNPIFETGEELIFRVSGIVHELLHASKARLIRELEDERAAKAEQARKEREALKEEGESQ